MTEPVRTGTKAVSRRPKLPALLVCMAFCVAAAGLQACNLRDRNELHWYEKPPPAPAAVPFVSELIDISAATFTATYSVQGTGLVGWADVVYADQRALLKTNVGGIDLSLYVTLSPLSVLACGSTGGVSGGCRPLPGGESTGNTATSLLSPQTYDTLVGLFTIPGADIYDKKMVGADGLCLRSPKSALSGEIILCLARAGGILFYANGEITISATSYAATADRALLVPPANSKSSVPGM